MESCTVKPEDSVLEITMRTKMGLVPPAYTHPNQPTTTHLRLKPEDTAGRRRISPETTRGPYCCCCPWYPAAIPPTAVLPVVLAAAGGVMGAERAEGNSSWIVFHSVVLMVSSNLGGSGTGERGGGGGLKYQSDMGAEIAILKSEHKDCGQGIFSSKLAST